MNVLVVGSGGREHALCWKISQSPLLDQLFCLPGNPGISEVATCIPGKLDDINSIIKGAMDCKADLVIVGPELPLTLGVSDRIKTELGILVFGPQEKAAMIEGSKSFSKKIMLSAGVPTAHSITVSTQKDAIAAQKKIGLPIVVKADGLAAGKGVFVCLDQAAFDEAISKVFGQLGSSVVLLEEFLDGVEASLIVMAHGRKYLPLDSSHDYKRLLDNNQGPNTGGMGTVSPSPRLPNQLLHKALEEVIEPTLLQLEREGMSFTGFLYAGLMILPSGELKVLEFNARLGDPETQVLLPRLDSDLLKVILELLDDTIPTPSSISWKQESAVCVVLASQGYPDSPKLAVPLKENLNYQKDPQIHIFHAGTTRSEDRQLVSHGGRVLNIVGLGNDLDQARKKAYEAVSQQTFEGSQFRKDIGLNCHDG